jgi:hypothetical protein
MQIIAVAGGVIECDSDAAEADLSALDRRPDRV